MDFQKNQKCHIYGIPQIFSSKYMHFLTFFDFFSIKKFFFLIVVVDGFSLSSIQYFF